MRFINPEKWYTNDNIDRMLMERHLNKKARRNSNKAHLKGPKKRTKKDDERFSESFEKLIQKALAASGFFQISFLQKLER